MRIDGLRENKTNTCGKKTPALQLVPLHWSIKEQLSSTGMSLLPLGRNLVDFTSNKP